MLTPRAEHERGAGFREPFGHFLSEPAGSTGDDGDAACQIEQCIDVWHAEAYTSAPVMCQLSASGLACALDAAARRVSPPGSANALISHAAPAAATATISHLVASAKNAGVKSGHPN